jgi:hypothetical protein
MWNEIILNLGVISFFAAILACIILANIFTGLFYNIGGAGEPFEIKRLIKGLLKGVVVLAACYLLTIALTAVPYAIEAAGISMDESLLESISIVVLFLIWGTAIIKYALAALETVRKILGVTTTVKKE